MRATSGVAERRRHANTGVFGLSSAGSETPLSLPSVSLITFDAGPASFGRALGLAGLGDIVARGDRVLLKPNQHGGPGTTSPAVMAAGARWAFSRGAAEVFIGDGPFWGMKGIEEYFRETGLLGACEATGARPLNFHAGPFDLLHPASPDLPETIGVSRHLREADVVINLPVLKTHFNTLVTLGIKNLKGCLRPIDKKTLHELELNAALAEVNRLLRPLVTATVIDATTGYEGMGPSAATPVEMGLLIASADVVAADSVACDLVGIAPERVRLIRACAERGVGEMHLERIAVTGEEPAAHRRRFKLPFEAIAEGFPGLTLHTEGACSGCAMNLFRAMELTREQGAQVACRAVVIGPGAATEGQTLLVGNCTREGWGAAPHVPGCPPRVEEIQAGLRGGPNALRGRASR